MMAVGVANWSVVYFDEGEYACKFINTVPEPALWCWVAIIVFLMPLVVFLFFLVTLRNVRDEWSEKRNTSIIAVISMGYVLFNALSYYASSAWPVLVRSLGLFYLQTMLGVTFWLYAGPACYELYMDKDKNDKVAVEERKKSLQLDMMTRGTRKSRRSDNTGRDAEATPEQSRGHEACGVALPPINVPEEVYTDPHVPALTQERPFSGEVLQHYIDNGMLLPAMMEYLTTSTGTAAFEQFLVGESSDENVKFLRAVNVYDRLAAPAIHAVCDEPATALRELFFHNEADMEINVTAVVTDGIGKMLNDKRAQPSIFNDARVQVMRLLSSDSFHRFILTDAFKVSVDELSAQDASQTPAQRAAGFSGESALELLAAESILVAERQRMVLAKTRGLREINIVTVGTGGTGKSTLVKQFRLLFGVAYNMTERKSWAQRIRLNMLNDAHHVLQAASNRPGFAGVPVVDKTLVMRLFSAQTAPVNEQVRVLKVAYAIEGVCTFMMEFIQDLSPQAKYFWGHAKRILDVDYVANDQDIIYCPSSTLGVTTFEFETPESTYHIVDCGGQRSQRKKWLHFFSAATAVLFVASLDDFWHCLAEAEDRNALHESIDTFDETINSPGVRSRTVILFLNKKDLLPASLEMYDFTKYFPQYKGDPKDWEKVANYIKGLFLARNKTAKRRRPVHVQFTCAGDTEQVKGITESIRNSLTQDIVADSGLVDGTTSL